MPSLAQIIYTMNGYTLDSCIYSVSSLQAAVDFCNATAPYRRADIQAVNWSSSGLVSYDRTETPARKRIDWTSAPASQSIGFSAPSNAPGQNVFNLLAFTVTDHDKTISPKGSRFFTIPAYVDNIEPAFSVIMTAFTLLFSPLPNLSLKRTRRFSIRH